MNCPYCAEEIKDEAVLCRFCGARRMQERWSPPGPPALQRPAGFLTIRIAAICFFLSALFTLGSITSPVTLYGALRTGAVATLHHLVFSAVFFGIGIGLWFAKPWGLKAVFVGTLIYSVDRFAYVFDTAGRNAELAHHSKGLGSLASMVDLGTIHAATSLLTLTFVACWWGFALYVYFRRGYFGGAVRSHSSDDSLGHRSSER